MSKTEKEMIEELYNDNEFFTASDSHTQAYNNCIDIVESIKPHGVKYNHDNVKSPKHYMFFDMEVIDIIKASMTKDQFIGYCKGNAIKYRLRAGKKDDTIQDISKAEEYQKFYDNII